MTPQPPNKSPEPTPVGPVSSASRFTFFCPAWLSFGSLDGSVFNAPWLSMCKFISSSVVGCLAFLAIFLLTCQSHAKSSITNFTKSVFYVPPKSFAMWDFSRDPDNYSDLFAYWGSGIEYNSTNGDSILFDLRPAAYPAPNNGEQNPYEGPLLPRSPDDLKADFLAWYRGIKLSFSDLLNPKIGKMAGYTCVSDSIQFTNSAVGTRYFYTCWIQIKSNIVVTVEIQAGDKNNFEGAKDSLKTLKINKREIINIVREKNNAMPPDW